MVSEVRVVSSLALLYTFRMLGLFMVLPVLALYSDQVSGATPLMIGIALGAYGLTQAVFQVPLGMLSDIFGRKKIIVFGLVLFAAGSAVAAMSSTIEGVIIGRLLQGSGAVASAIMAMVADLTSEENRTKAMASIGASIGLSFTVAMVLGPLVAGIFGLSGVFYLAGILAVIGIFLVIFVVPSAKGSRQVHGDAGAVPKLLGGTLKNTELLRLNLGIFILHAVLMATFIALPEMLLQSGLVRENHWWVYLPVLLLSFVVMIPFILISEKKRRIKTFFIASIALLMACMAIFAFTGVSIWGIAFGIFVFFVAFNFLEATLPSWLSKSSPAGSKGTAMGVYSTHQFMGAFVGGSLGGVLMASYGVLGVFAGCAGLLAVWLVVAAIMRGPRYLSSLCVEVDESFNAVDTVLALDGVAEAKHVRQQNLLYLKVDKRDFVRNQLDSLIKA